MELGQLAVYVALDPNTTSQPNAAQARVYLESLNEWHRTLPPSMQLSRLSLSDPLTMSWHEKRSLLQLHLLFLGLFVKPYRGCLVDLGRFRLSNTPIETEVGGLESDRGAMCPSCTTIRSGGIATTARQLDPVPLLGFSVRQL
jgi:hypothetical protein